jgi:diguanylate cyclase (GGDEF)-like protein
MTQLIDHLAELTGFRDRELLDVSVVRAVHDVLRPLAVGIYRSVGEAGSQRWLTRARMALGDATATADPAWTEVLSLPRIDSVPCRHACLTSAKVITAGEGPQHSYFPISTEREVIGVLELETALGLTPGERAMVSTILRIYGNFHDLLDHSERDPLTGLLNRQTFSAALNRAGRLPLSATENSAEGQRSVCTDASGWLGVVDIDHFKRVNDTYGHPIGDEVLLLLSRVLRSSFRHQDRLYRFGGEEFVVVLDGLDGDGASNAFERLRVNVNRFAFPQVGQVTVSIGFTKTDASETPSVAFTRADKALYYAKEHGRDLVACFDDLVVAGSLSETKIATGDIDLF